MILPGTISLHYYATTTTEGGIKVEFFNNASDAEETQTASGDCLSDDCDGLVVIHQLDGKYYLHKELPTEQLFELETGR